MATRFCTACGTQLGEGVSFCTACGAPVAAPTAAEPQVEPPAEMAEPSPEVPPEEPIAEAAPEEPVPLGLRGRGGAPAPEQPSYDEPEPGGAKSPPWAIIIGGGLVLCVLIAAALAFSGEFQRQFGGSTSSSSTYPSAPDSNSTYSSVPAPRPMTMPSNAQYFFGTWGPNCPQSRADAITFYSDGTFLAPGGAGVWSIDTGSTIIMTGNGRTVVSRWSFSSGDSAVAYNMGPVEAMPVRRCS